MAKRDSPASDGPAEWLTAVQDYVRRSGDELHLDDLRAGDCIEVRTRHTRYRFVWPGGGDGSAELVTDQPDRPSGPVVIMGCALGAGTTIAPGRLFTGGSLEFTSEAGALVHRTTPVQEIRWLHQAFD